MKMNVILALINPITKQIRTKEYSDISEEAANRIWLENLQDSKGASTGNLGYEPENYPKYYASTGFIPSNGFLYTWVQWESK